MVSFLGWVYPNNDVKVTENKIAFTESGKGKLMPFGEVKFLGRLVKEFGTDEPLVSDSKGGIWKRSIFTDSVPCICTS